MPDAAINSEIDYFCDGFLSLRWRKKKLKIRGSFTLDGTGGTINGTIEEGPTHLLSQSVTVVSPDLIRASIRFE